ncbi:uncharacterized protein [Argopecten irradians]
MEIIPAKRRAYSISNKMVSVSTVNSKVSGGAMISPTTFVKHWSIQQKVQVTFEHDEEVLSITKVLRDNPPEELTEVMEMSYNSLTDTFIAHYNSDAWRLYIGLKNPPKLLEKSQTQRRRSPQLIKEEKRIVSLTSVTLEDIGNTSVICIEVPVVKTTEATKQMSEDMWTVIARLKRHGFSISYANVSEKTPDNTRYNKIKYNTFEQEYAWNCLLSCGFKITDAITEEAMIQLEEQKSVVTAGIFHEMTSKADNCQFFEFERIFTESLHKLDSSKQTNESDELPPHFSMTRRLVVTPTRVIPLRKEPIVKNRIIRQYDDDYFIRVIFRDEDFTRLSAAQAEGLKNITERIRRFMDAKFEIGGRTYEFLACSNSQLREHGVWFFCPNNGHTADSIRLAAGDLSQERNIATYVSRMGLCFSASRPTVEVDVDSGSVKYIDDIKSGNYCFTDGIGKISVPLAKKVADSLLMDPVPSAFQIRYGGCKGVVSQDPNLGNSEEIHIRKSMRKFNSPSKNLEILQTTHPGQLHLNRQVITLLSGLGVKDTVFMALQEKMLFKMADMFLDNTLAARALAEANLGIKYKDLMRAGVSLINEAFFRSVLMTIYKRKHGELIRKTRIEIDYDQGRSMMGTVDETGTLAYGQVFVSYTRYDGMNFIGTKILQTEVVVAKNPCFHPGDLRKFQAVDVPELHHFVDCIVFPQNGLRPHPNEMSGSDLDGDMYFVCWDKNMHPPGQNKEAMDYESPGKSLLYRDVEVSDVTNFIADYIRNDQLGVIANAHVVHADLKNIFCPECITLSKKHSDAVDFPKTGQVPEMTHDLRCEKYPDFMMKSDKPRYASKNVLGKLYRECKSLEKAHNRTYEQNLLQSAIVVDTDMMYPGYESYLDSAYLSRDLYNDKILQLMSLYGIETEAEVVTGIVQKLHKKRGYLQNEKYEVGKIIQGKMSVIRQKVRTDFFEEFVGEGEETCISEDDKNKVLAKASAWYIAAYGQKGTAGKRLVSFPWIVSKLLSEIKANAGNYPSRENVIPNAQNRLVLAQIGSSVVRHFDTNYNERLNTFAFLNECFTKVSRYLPTDNVRLFFTGIQSLCLMDRYSREIDVCLQFQGQLPHLHIKKLIDSVMSGYKRVGPRTISLVHEDTEVFVRLFTNKDDLERTNFIRQQLQLHTHYTVILTFLLDWARKYGLIRILCNEVVFVLLVLQLLSDADNCSTTLEHMQQTHMQQTDAPRWFPGRLIENDHANIAKLLLDVLKKLPSLLNRNQDGDIPVHSPDPTDKRRQPSLIPKLDWRSCKHLTEEILFAYQSIAKHRSVDVFFEQNIYEDGRLMINLPLEIWGSVMFAETYTARRLSEETGAEVSIRRKIFRDTRGLILEAWGSLEQLWNVEKSLQDLNDKSSKFISTIAREIVFIDGAFKRIFYGATSPDQQLTLTRYNGRCQPQHKDLALHIASIGPPYQDTSACLDTFKEVFKRQVELIRQDFESTYHGDLRIALTFGTYYLTYVDNPNLTISELETEMESRVNPKDKQADMNLPGRRIWRSRKRQGRFTKPKPRHIRGSFLPVECDKSNVGVFLDNSCFEKRHEEVKYHATLKIGNQDYGKRHEGIAILDKDIKFIELRLSDLKWLAVDVCRGYEDKANAKKRLDVRCKLQSRRVMDLEGVQEMPDTKILLEPSTRVLVKPDNHTLYVAPEFKDRVTFVREKHVNSYHCNRPMDEYSIWQEMRIEIAQVLEYSIPDVSGKFQEMVEKQEVTVIPKLLPLETSDTEWEQYAENIWELIEHLGEQFDKNSI